MKGSDPDLMAAELQRLKPARPPAELIDRLLAALPATPSPQPPPSRRATWSLEWWLPWLRWLAPVSAVGIVTLLSFRQVPVALDHPGAAMNADAVQIQHKLVSAYDAVGELPGGEPVRFRVREWTDSTVLHDSARGLVVEQSKPRFEVVPVEFVTY